MPSPVVLISNHLNNGHFNDQQAVMAPSKTTSKQHQDSQKLIKLLVFLFIYFRATSITIHALHCVHLQCRRLKVEDRKHTSNKHIHS